MALERVAGLDELADGAVLAVMVGGKAVCLARIGDDVFAFQDNCTHRDFPLSGGELDVDDCSITCDWHGARFDVRTGKVLALPATKPIRTYDCTIENDEIFVDVS